MGAIKHVADFRLNVLRFLGLENAKCFSARRGLQQQAAYRLSRAPSYIDISAGLAWLENWLPNLWPNTQKCNWTTTRRRWRAAVIFVLFVFFRQLPKVYLSCHCATCAARLMPGWRAFLTYPAIQQWSVSVPNGNHICIPANCSHASRADVCLFPMWITLA